MMFQLTQDFNDFWSSLLGLVCPQVSTGQLSCYTFIKRGVDTVATSYEFGMGNCRIPVGFPSTYIYILEKVFVVSYETI